MYGVAPLITDPPSANSTSLLNSPLFLPPTLNCRNFEQNLKKNRRRKLIILNVQIGGYAANAVSLGFCLRPLLNRNLHPLSGFLATAPFFVVQSLVVILEYIP